MRIGRLLAPIRLIFPHPQVTLRSSNRDRNTTCSNSEWLLGITLLHGIISLFESIRDIRVKPKRGFIFSPHPAEAASAKASNCR